MIFLFLFIVISLFSSLNCLPLPFNEYSYMNAREKIKQHDRAVQAQNNLNIKEKIANLYLEHLRAEEFLRTKDYFYPARPIETEVENITKSPFFKFLLPLPKGGNLHIHEFQILDRKVLLQSIFNSSEYDLLYICDQNNCESTKYYLRYYKTDVPSGWTKVKDSNWTIENILKKTTLTGILSERPTYATDTAARWNTAEVTGLFSFYNDLTRYNTTRFNYMKLILDQALEENVQILELRRGAFGRLFSFHDNGSRIVISAEEELRMLLEFKRDYIEKNPKLIDFVFVLYGGRRASKDEIRNEIESVIELQRSYPDFIRGYDLVGEEDLGHTLLFHSESLINAFNYSQKSNGTFDLLFHAGETNWPQDHLPANFGDGVSTFENIYDALVLRTRRIGHGLSLAKRPDLYDYIRQREIAIEICPASNQILGYVADLRNHPGIVYHRSGIPIVLAGDDPGSFGYNQLTVEFYLATMAWGLNLADLKQFAWNSIKYSSLPDSQKIIGFDKWQKEWDRFIDSTNVLACNSTLSNATMNVSGILPSYGPFDQSINVTIFGEGFEKAICKRILCRFGDLETNGSMIDINEIHCPTPSGTQNLSSVPVSLVVNNEIIPTGIRFTYLSSVAIIDDGTLTTTTVQTTPVRSRSDSVMIINHILLLTFVLLLFSIKTKS